MQNVFKYKDLLNRLKLEKYMFYYVKCIIILKICDNRKKVYSVLIFVKKIDKRKKSLLQSIG